VNNSRVVDEDVDPSPALQDLLDQAFDFSLLTDIGAESKRVFSQCSNLVRDLGQGGVIADTHDRHVCSFPRKGHSDGASDPAASTRNQRDFLS